MQGERMKTYRDLEKTLASMDRRGYPAYKSLRGAYDFGDFVLCVDRVQGDPFASPSKMSARVPARTAGFAPELFDVPCRRVALEDYLVRRLAAECARASFKVGGSGKSGLIATSKPGPEVLSRSACEISDDGSVTLRFEAGLPAHGRTTDARAASRMLLDLIPRCVRAALPSDPAAKASAQAVVDLADDQQAVRESLGRMGLVAFVADGSVLPRESGVSSRPLKGARPFVSPESMRVEIDLPHRGRISGMGIRRGVTLVVGGGYHGKSTLLKALQEGVYNHAAGDGRELAISDATAVKLRAEDGRAVRRVDISPFIDNLPDGRDTHTFSTLDASGSTSQAASTMEALEAGARVLLIDEDTSATNFMVRDALMEAVVAAEHEPITPFVERVRELWEKHGVSSVIVVGSSGAFFSEADAVVQMDCYEALDITERVREVCRQRLGLLHQESSSIAEERRAGADTVAQVEDSFEAASTGAARRLELSVAGNPGRGRSGGEDSCAGRGGKGRGGRNGRDARSGRDGLKVRVRGLEGFEVGKGTVDARQVEQLVDAEQSAVLGQMVRMVIERGILDGEHSLADAVDWAFDALERGGWEALSPYGDAACGLAMPRKEELFACLNRWRGGARQG